MFFATKAEFIVHSFGISLGLHYICSNNSKSYVYSYLILRSQQCLGTTQIVNIA